MKKKSIIVIDDSKSLRERIKEVVETFPHIELIGEADNGVDAIELIKAKQPDFVTLDINMPKKSGIQVLKAIDPFNNDIEVVVITNHADKIYRDKCLKFGASHFLDKTNEFQVLKEILAI